MDGGFSARLHPSRSETFPYPDRSFHFGDTRVTYFDGGRGRTPLVFVHGLGANMTHFEYVAPGLESMGFRVCGLDLPGFGHSGRRDGEYRVRWLADSLAALLDHLGLRDAVVCGHSLGGMLAADLALRCPERVRALVLISPGGLFKIPPAVGAALRATMRPALVAPALEHGARAILKVVLAQENDRTRLFVRRSVERPAPEFCPDLARTMWLARGDLTTWDMLDDGPRLAMPVLVLWGGRDRLLPSKHVPSWVRTLPDGRLEVLPECGHMPMIEDPDAVLRAAGAFLREKLPGAFDGG